jgi:penicillin amidase
MPLIKTGLLWLGGFLVLLLVLVGSLASWLTWRFYSSTPDYSAEVRLDDARYAPLIVRDRNGIPHIFGQTNEDVWFGLGYAHAQDRLFEMDMMRRSIWGTVSEVIPGVVSRRILQNDLNARSQGHNVTAREIYENMPEDGKAALAAYSDGVNAFIDNNRSKWPFGYALLMTKPEPWRPEDSITPTLMMTHMLSVSSGAERHEKPDNLSDEVWQARQLRRGRLSEPNITTIHSQDLPERLRAQPQPTANAEPEPLPGSNAWVVAGERSASGAPLLASDPHLPPMLPSTWFLARLSMPHGDVVGATIPGAPFVIIGRNDHVAWGITNAGFDVGDHVPLSDDIQTKLSDEVVFRRFASPIVVPVERSVDGFVKRIENYNAVLGQLSDEFYVWEREPIIVKTTADDGDNLTPYALMQFNFATSIEEMTEAIDDYWVAPVQALILADKAGNIGFHAAGRVPLRDEEGTWTGEIPLEDSLRVLNPKRGFLANANNQIHPPDYTYPVPGYYAPERITRIYEWLDNDQVVDLETMQAMQLDVTSSFAIATRALWEEAQPLTEEGKALQDLLLAWDGVVTAETSIDDLNDTALRYFEFHITRDETVMEEVYRETDAKTPYAEMQPVGRFQRPFVRTLLRDESAHWCDNIYTDTVETCAEEAGRALDRVAALDESEISRRTELRLAHPLYSQLPLIGGNWVRETLIDGEATTLNVAHSRKEGDVDRAVFTTNYRMLVDFAAMDEARFIHMPGQSSHPRSAYFDNLLDDWAEGRYITIAPQDAEGENVEVTRFVTPR